MYNSFPSHENQVQVPIFENFSEASQYFSHCKTKNNWLKNLRKVKIGSIPLAYVKVFNKVFKKTYLVGLFDESCTVPYQPTPLTVARWRYQEIFTRCQGEINIFYNPSKRDSEGNIKPGWTAHKDYLRLDEIKNHINSRHIYGVRAKSNDSLCSFFTIDLDCHNGPKNIFMQMLRVLLDEFYYKKASHIEIADSNAQGVHLRQIFKPIKIADMHKNVRSILQRLENEHPVLNQQAIDNGMKSFSKLELFPNGSSGIRLPLCKGRTVLLDKPHTKMYKKRCNNPVGDVIGFVDWIDDWKRKYMSIEDVMRYVDEHVDLPTKYTSMPVIKDIPVIKDMHEDIPEIKDMHEDMPVIKDITSKAVSNEHIFELADRHLYPSLERIAYIGLVPKNLLQENGQAPSENSALAVICVKFAMVLWHDELFHVPEQERFKRIVRLLTRWVFAKHNNVCKRLENKQDSKDVVKQITNCVKTAMKSEDHNGFFFQVRYNKENNVYKRIISLEDILHREGREGRNRFIYIISVSDSPLPQNLLAILDTVKPKTRPKPFLQFATRFINHLKAHEGTATLSQAQGFELLGYANPTRYTDYKEKLIEADLIQLAQESVAHQRACVYSLTRKARELLGMTVNDSTKIPKRIRYSDEDVIAALETL